jgi:hypothetical protein
LKKEEKKLVFFIVVQITATILEGKLMDYSNLNIIKKNRIFLKVITLSMILKV